MGQPATTSAAKARPRGVAVIGRRLTTGLAWLVLIGLSAAVAVVGSFLIPVGPRVGTTQVSVALPYALVVTPLLVAVSGRLAPRLGAVASLGLWLVTVVVLASGSPEGDEVVTGDLRGLGYMLLGALTGALSLGLGGNRTSSTT